MAAAIYCRISRDRTGAGLGVERQEEDCRVLAASLGLDVAEVFVDNDLSAYSGKPRPEYDRLLAGIKAGRFDAVIVWHQDRLLRRNSALEGHIGVCEPRSIPTYAVRAVRRSAGPTGEGIDQSVAGHRTGLWPGLDRCGQPRFGVDASGRPKVAERIERIGDERLDHHCSWFVVVRLRS